MRGFVEDKDDLTMELLIETVNAHLGDIAITVGASNLLQNKGAFLADISSLTVLPLIQNHLRSAILLAPNRLLMRPSRQSSGANRATPAGCGSARK